MLTQSTWLTASSACKPATYSIARIDEANILLLLIASHPQLYDVVAPRITIPDSRRTVYEPNQPSYRMFAVQEYSSKQDCSDTRIKCNYPTIPGGPIPLERTTQNDTRTNGWRCTRIKTLFFQFLAVAIPARNRLRFSAEGIPGVAPEGNR